MIGCDFSQLVEWVAEGKEKGACDSVSEQIPICIDSPAALAARSRRWADAGVDAGCHDWCECVCVCLHCERYDLCRSKLHIGEEITHLIEISEPPTNFKHQFPLLEHMLTLHSSS